MSTALAYDLTNPEGPVHDSPPVSIERGKLLAQMLEELLSRVMSSERGRLLADLLCAAAETASDEWQAQGGAAARFETFGQALAFLMTLPLNLPRPEIMAEQNGDITFEWYAGPRRVLSAILGPRPALAYAALIDASTARGTEPFLGRFPQILSDLLTRIYPERPDKKARAIRR
jgi:hypothetical protein